MRAMKGIAAALVLAALPWSAAQAHVGFGIGINLGAPYYYGSPYYNPYPYYYYNHIRCMRPRLPWSSSPPRCPDRPAVRPRTLRRRRPCRRPRPCRRAVDAPARPARLAAAGRRRAADAAAGQCRRPRPRRRRRRFGAHEGDAGRAAVDADCWPATAAPSVREAAARALGLIGDTATLPALQRAAQADDDHDVRHSAQFAAEVIRSNLPR